MMKPRDTRENIGLFKIASTFCDLAKLQQLIKENPKHATFLKEFFKLPVTQLKDFKVTKAKISEFIANRTQLPLSLEFIESFRKTESRRFWE